MTKKPKKPPAPHDTPAQESAPAQDSTPAQDGTAAPARRYAIPSFATPLRTTRTKAAAELVAFSKNHLGAIPPIRGDGRMNLTDIIGQEGVTEIEDIGEIRIHVVGDTGVNHAEEAEKVAEEMATDFKPTAGGLNPAFFFHLGDVIYGDDKQLHYGERFYRPYMHYPGKILAIPGNHDGEMRSDKDKPSLKDFTANFCAETAHVPPEASASGIFRETMTQPGVYWMLDAPFVRIIGLYSNLLENPGSLHGANDDKAQVTWLRSTLAALKTMPKKALIMATHHPPYSTGGHSGSIDMRLEIDQICAATGVSPDLFLSGHAHNYQRYTRRIGAKRVPYIVAGTGGIGVQAVPPATGQPADDSGHATYDAAMKSYGYLFVTVAKTQIKTEFWPLGDEHVTPFDPLTVDLTTGVLTQGH